MRARWWAETTMGAWGGMLFLVWIHGLYALFYDQSVLTRIGIDVQGRSLVYKPGRRPPLFLPYPHHLPLPPCSILPTTPSSISPSLALHLVNDSPLASRAPSGLPSPSHLTRRGRKSSTPSLESPTLTLVWIAGSLASFAMTSMVSKFQLQGQFVPLLRVSAPLAMAGSASTPAITTIHM